jgi:FkbM family methyltransferase
VGILNKVRNQYHQLFPSSLREPVWHLHAALRTADIYQRRRHLLEFRIAAGYPMATVRVEGLRMHVDLRDQSIAVGMYIYRAYEPLETGFIRKTLRPGDIFVDIGANIGYYSVRGAKLVGSSGRVIAVEPDLYNSELLRRNATANGVAGIVRHVRVALGAEKSVGRLYRSPVNFGDHRVYDSDTQTRETVEICIEPLDEVVGGLGLSRIDLVKMDVQGYEHQALRGMTEVLRSAKPTILTEFWPDGIRAAGGSPEALLEILAGAGYSAFLLTHEGLDPLAMTDVIKAVPPFDSSHPDASYLNLVFSTI